MNKWTVLLAGIILVASVGIGAKALAENKDETGLKQVQQAEFPQEEREGMTLNKATEIALQKVENGVVTEADIDQEHGQVVYEVEVKTNELEYDFKINQSGEIIKEKKEKRDDHDDEENRIRSGENTISVEQAKTIALKEVSGFVDDLDLEEENGMLIYEIEIEQKTDRDDDEATVYVNALTGEVLSIEWD